MTSMTETPTDETPKASADAVDFSSDDFVFTYDDYEEPKALVNYVTVLHGYGRMRPNQKHCIDNVEFTGGIARDVPEDTARAWKAIPAFKIQILPNDATEVDFARKVGIKPMNPTKLAALLGASDVDQLVAALGQQKTNELIDALARRLTAGSNTRRRVTPTR